MKGNLFFSKCNKKAKNMIYYAYQLLFKTDEEERMDTVLEARYNASDVANYLLYLFQYDEDGLSNLKINKLLYYAQGFSFQRLGKPLFKETIQAWEHGPVVPSVYRQFKDYEAQRIPYDADTILPSLSPEEEQLLIDLVREYGCFTGAKLRNMTHRVNTPWQKVYTGERNVDIPLESIQEYFTSTETRLPSFELSFDPSDFVGYRNDDNVLVVPVEYK